MNIRRSFAPAGVTLKGKHPAAENSLEDIPRACLDCHKLDAKTGVWSMPSGPEQ